jgi:hypothetical protein
MQTLVDRLPQLVKFAADKEMEITLVLFPESTRKSSIGAWSDKPTELRARQVAEEVMTEADTFEPAPTSFVPSKPFVPARAGVIPACFQTFNACDTATNACNGHGVCEDKWAREDGGHMGDKICFACRCEGTVGESGSYTHWAGPTCAKIDISTPFWLFVGFTVMLIGILSAAIGLLFQVGEEQLPGVIGAGVAKGK